MAQKNQFRPGQKAPNHDVYMEIGETGSMVNDPKFIELEAGQRFPENSNENRIWMRKPKPSR